MAISPLEPLFFHHAEQLLSLAGPSVPRRGKALSELGIIRDGALLTRGEKILRVGRTQDLSNEARRAGARFIRCRGRIVLPGFVDSHTHLVFAGNRVEDFARRLQGMSYEQIAAAGGGIRSTAGLVGRASLPRLIEHVAPFLARFALHGTTTLEVKSGYGLNVAGETKILKAVRELRRETALELVPTLLAAHALPPAYRGRRREYVRLIAQRLIPRVAREGLAEFIDCFCDQGAFSRADCRRVLEAGQRHGLVPRIHAEQWARTRGSSLAVELRAASADHLDRISPADLRQLARSGVVATLLPGSNFFLGHPPYPPARRLIEEGAAVALATDFNPGTSPTPNMQFILSLACFALKMSPAEAITAATINGAFSLRRAHRLGSLEPGKQADIAVMAVGDYRELPYWFGVNHCVLTAKAGRIVYGTC